MNSNTYTFRAILFFYLKANESTTTTTNESLSSDDSISNDTLSALVKKSRDLSHLQKNLLTKSRTRERQTKST